MNLRVRVPAFGLCALCFCGLYAKAATNYVSLSGSHTPPYSSWATAANNIQDAVDLAGGDDIVLVTNGTYTTGTRLTPGYSLPNRLVVTNGTTVASVNGPEVTLIIGAGPVGSSAVRCVYLSGGSTLEGFTLHTGYTFNSGDIIFNRSGGGVLMTSADTVRRCIIRNCSASHVGGAVYANGGRLESCLIRNNVSLGWVGGVHNGNLVNCTIVKNQSANDAGGTYGGTLFNCIVVNNTAVLTYPNCQGGNLNYCCTTPLPAAGDGNITDAPSFADAISGDYRLSPGSACINSGTNQSWMVGACDLKGNLRVIGETVDMGAYESALYVSLAGNHLSPFLSWSDAATNIQAAVDVAMDGDTVVMDDGVFTVSQQVTLAKGILLTSVNGPGATVIEGGATCRCVYMAHTNAVLENVTLRGGHATHGGGVFIQMPGGTVRDAIIQNCLATYGSGLFFGGSSGGFEGIVQRCVIRSNGATSGGSQGGGVYLRTGTTAENCLVYGNSASEGGGLFCFEGGTVRNCTVVENTATLVGGGIKAYSAGCSVQNSIIYGNNCLISPNYTQVGATLSYCCTIPLPTGTGNITNAPLFVSEVISNYRLSPDSPCINSGRYQTWMAGALDLDGESRVVDGTVDMGAYEFDPAPYIDITNGNETVNGEVILYAISGTNNSWTVGTLFWTNASNAANGTIPVSGLAFQIVSIPLAFGDNLITVTGCNGVGDAAGDNVTITRRTEHGGSSPIHYVALSGNGQWPYTNWVSAATNIQESIDAAVDGDTVIMDDGVFIVSQQVSLAKGILLTSVNGSDATVIEGGVMNRCVYMAHKNAVLENVTLRDGHATHGGGVYIQMPGGTVRDAIIENCLATYGSGVFFGGSSGGFEGMVERCIIRSNGATSSGSQAGGVYLRAGATAENCLIYGNSAREGGGLFCYLDGTVRNCTVVENTATFVDGGIRFYSGGSAQNSIIYGNNCGTSPNYTQIGATLSYCCTTPIPVGSGHVSPPPLFVDSAQYDYRLTLGSPCIDAGADVSAYLNNDLDGMPRPLDGDANGSAIPDMGTYEYMNGVADSDGDGLSDGTEVYTYGTNPALADTDDDGLNDGNEVDLGFAPTIHSAGAIAYGESLGEANVTNNPAAYNLYTPESIMDLNMGYMMLQTSNDWVWLNLQLEKCTNLTEGVWQDAGDAVLWEVPADPGKAFFRVRGGSSGLLSLYACPELY